MSDSIWTKEYGSPHMDKEATHDQVARLIKATPSNDLPPHGGMTEIAIMWESKGLVTMKREHSGMTTLVLTDEGRRIADEHID